VCGDALRQRVVDFRDGYVGGWVDGAVNCELDQLSVDVDAEGVLCWEFVVFGCEVNKYRCFCVEGGMYSFQRLRSEIINFNEHQGIMNRLSYTCGTKGSRILNTET